MATYGRKTTTSQASGTITGQLRSTVFLAMPENGWAYEFGIHAGDTVAGAPNPAVRGHVHTAPSGTPDALHGYTNQFNVTNVMGSGATAGENLADLVNIIPLTAGQQYAIGAAAITASLLHGLATSSLPPGSNTTLYRRAVATTGPWDPHGYTIADTQGLMTTWLEYVANVAPNVPVLSPSGLLADPPTAFTGTFVDTNQTVDGRSNTAEVLTAYKIQLREVASGTILWDVLHAATTGPGSEQEADLFSRSYAGSSPLDPGVPYEWRAQVADFFGTYSDWSAWTQFTITSDGSVSPDGDGGVFGRQTTLTPGPFEVVYAHTTPLDATEHQIQILQAGVVVRDQVIVAAWSPGAHTISPTWDGTFPALSWSTAYTWRARAKDTNAEQSEWSTPVAFNTNYKPSTPSGLDPSGGEVSSGFPEFTFAMTDADNTALTGLTAQIRIKDSLGALLQTRAAALGLDGLWHYQATGVDLPATGVYRWDARGQDGTLDGDYSAEADFYYAQQPVITAPLDEAALTSTTVSITYTITGQVERRAVFTRLDAEDDGLSTSWEATASMTLEVDGSAYFQNGGRYQLVIEVELSGSIVTVSAPIEFDLFLDAGHSVEVDEVASGAIAIGFDSVESAIGLIRGTVIGVTASNFQKWRIKEGPGNWLSRYEALAGSGLEGSDLLRAQIIMAKELVTVAESSTFDQTAFTFFEPRLNIPQTYFLTAVVQEGINTIDSLPVNGLAITVSTASIVIHDTLEPTARRVVLEYLSSSETEDVGESALFAVWVDGPPVVVESGLQYDTWAERYKLVSTAEGTAEEKWQMLKVLRRIRETDKSAIVVCIRDDLGDRRYGRIMQLSAGRDELRNRTASIGVTEVRR